MRLPLMLLPALFLAPASVPARPALAQAQVERANAAALRTPRRDGFVNARQMYSWSDGALYEVVTAPERVTDVVLQPGEQLVSVAAGDTARWVIGDTTSGTGDAKRTHLLVKPVSAGLETNLVMATDRRTYHLALSSRRSGAMAAVGWSYPFDELLALKRANAEHEALAPVAPAIAVEQLNFGYTIDGDRPAWRPVRAFDDGRQVYLQFPATLGVGEAPPLFVVGEKGEAQLVNYRVRGNYYVVDRLFDRAELRLGEKRQVVVRIAKAGVTQRRKRIL